MYRSSKTYTWPRLGVFLLRTPQRILIIENVPEYKEIAILNSSKASTSVMLVVTGEGKILPPYVVYKAQHLYDGWRERGPKNSRYNRTQSGGFDTFYFSDWVESVAIPSFKDLEGI